MFGTVLLLDCVLSIGASGRTFTSIYRQRRGSHCRPCSEGAKIYPSPTDPPIENGSSVMRDRLIFSVGSRLDYKCTSRRFLSMGASSDTVEGY
jgi:hypothetical protein